MFSGEIRYHSNLSTKRVLAVTCAALLVLALFGSVLSYAPEVGADDSTYRVTQGFFYAGCGFKHSSVLAVDLEGDGPQELIIGNLNGRVYCFDAYANVLWQNDTGAPVEGTPAAADVNGDGQKEVFVGNMGGTMFGFTADGQNLPGWPQTTPMVGGYQGIFSSPAIGDLDGDKDLEIVAGTYGHFVYVWHHDGRVAAGWPYNNEDTIWSSPALADIDLDGLKEVVIGADSSGGVNWPYPPGGLLYVLNGDGTLVPGFPKITPEVTWSSPAVGDFDGDEYPEIIVGTGHYYKNIGRIGTEGHRVYAYNHDGSPLPGWPVETMDSTFSSPALADLDGDGGLEAVIADNSYNVYALESDGTVIWHRVGPGGPTMGSPAVADIDGIGTPEVVLGCGIEVCAWNSSGGLVWQQPVNVQAISSPAVGDFDVDGKTEVAIATGADTDAGGFYVFEWGNAKPGGREGEEEEEEEDIDSWPQFRREPLHQAAWKFAAKPIPRAVPANFNEYILLMNPGDRPAEASVLLYDSTGRNCALTVPLAGKSRSTVHVNCFMPMSEVSAVVSSDVPIIAERAMYFNFKGIWTGGHDCTGVMYPAKEWYLAEGCTSSNFREYALIQNPGDEVAEVSAVYMREAGPPISQSYTLAPMSRYTVAVNEVPGIGEGGVSARFSSDREVIVERSMYFDYMGNIGGHGCTGVTEPSNQWFLAEGYTGGAFDTFVLVQNPSGSEAEVRFDFMRTDGHVATETRKVGAQGRLTVKVDDVPGFEDASVSTRVSAESPIIAERAMYFDYGGARGGHVSVGVPGDSEQWFLAEGYTGGGFDTFVLVMNPHSTGVPVRTTLMRSDGHVWSRTDEMLPHSRMTIMLDEIPGFEDAEVSTQVDSLGDDGVIVERAMYFSYGDGITGGHDSVGAREASKTWFFAEGYTGD